MSFLFAIHHWLHLKLAAFRKALQPSRKFGPHRTKLSRGEAQTPTRPRLRPSSGHNAWDDSGAQAQVRVVLRQLKVVQIVDRDLPGGSSGRLLICGSMDDVCAELDRLVKHEQSKAGAGYPLPHVT